MRVKGVNNYIDFVDRLLHARLQSGIYNSEDYEFIVFDSLADLYNELKKREEKYKGLCRLVAGYSWPWLSESDKSAIDIKIDGLEFQWNQTHKDWVNSPNAFKEIGCIHTTQGYDLNVTGIIFGKEINYNKVANEIPKNVF